MVKKDMKYYIAYFFIAVAIIIITASFSMWFIGRTKDKSETLSPTFSDNKNCSTFVIDPGHGGEDGGAIADDGTTEKELNLLLAKNLSLLLELNGEKAVMTRETDTLLYDKYGDLDNYKGKKKIYDLKNRVKITNEQQSPVYIGIHMNKFPDERYSGLQVYYSKNNEKSKLLAENVQKNTHAYIQNTNNRAIKRADGSIYILDSLNCPSVLIECGFMSNPNELELLKSQEYRRDLATVIFISAINTPRTD
ncbi:MAG: N-acetylmuramoyl-L-alanine amidase [Clostridia bacterium]|nr:N-acetylmuramoyl-L-alanine amidase [Clostridia bacterium]